MWPWEHLAFGYVLYSGYTRLRYGRPPDHRPVLALAVGTQVPDLVDKPLAWTLDVLPTARSLGHSGLVAVVVAALAVIVARRRGELAVGVAAAIGYLSHLLGDVIYPLMLGGSVQVHYLFWPLVRQPERATRSLYGRTIHLFSEFTAYLGSPRGVAFLTLEFALAVAVLVLWFADGRPGLPEPG